MRKQESENYYDGLPVGRLGMIPMENCSPLGKKVDDYLVSWRKERAHQNESILQDYMRDSFIIPSKVPRFGSGEAKGLINESVRGDDIYLLTDVTNYSMTYKLFGRETNMSPDDHFQDLKRIIAAIGGKARRINVIMPFLYESRQHRRSGRESLDCALALQELVNMGVDNIITFDAHDPRVQNSIPLHGFETVQSAYQFIKNILRNAPDMQIDSNHLMVISPDEGGTKRAIYMDKDMIIIDDMISSGDSMIEVATLLKKHGARNIYLCSTFGLFTNGLLKFDQAYEQGLFTKLLTTNLVYQSPELLEKPWYVSCDMSKYTALIIDTLNHDSSISGLLDPAERIQKVLGKFRNHEKI